MRKLLVIAICCFLSVVSIAQSSGSEEPPDAPPRPLDQWTFFELGFFPNIPGYTKKSNCYGFKLGVPMCSGWGRVYGLEASGLYSGTNYINGIQASWFGASVSREVNGIQATWFGVCVGKKVKGIQSSWGACVAEDVIGLQASGVNVSKSFYGFQASAVNVAEPVIGFQAGAVNVAEELDGVQLGVVNYSKSKGCQFGFINIIEDGWLPFSILFNISY